VGLHRCGYPMSQLQTKLSERMAKKRRAKSRNIMLPFADLPKMADVLFLGCDGEYLGEVVAKASPAGREAVEKLFPDCHIKGANINVRSLSR
jgi:hypothetical protein